MDKEKFEQKEIEAYEFLASNKKKEFNKLINKLIGDLNQYKNSEYAKLKEQEEKSGKIKYY